MTKTLDPISVIEAAYDIDAPQQAWLEGIAKTLQAVNGSTLGAMAMLYDATRDDWISPLCFVNCDFPAQLAQGLFNQPISVEEGALLSRVYRTHGVAMLRDSPLPRRLLQQHALLLDQAGIADVLAVNAIDPTHHGCIVLMPTAVNATKSRARVWRRLGAHIAAGVRLRRSLEELAKEQVAPTEGAEAVVSPNGHVDHAVGPATAEGALERLRDSIVRVERARSRKPSSDEAVELWEALVDGRWSVVEHFERDGKRYYLAHRNEAKLAANRALSEREQQVLAYAELGCSNKLIAYSLGVATSTVSSLLTSARRKLGTRAKR